MVDVGVLNLTPYNNIQDFEQYSEVTLQDQNEIFQLKSNLSELRHGNLETVVKRMLKSLMTDKLASEYSMLGTKTLATQQVDQVTLKRPFKQLKIYSIVLALAPRLASQSSKGAGISHEIDNIIGTWLKQAPRRFNLHQVG